MTVEQLIALLQEQPGHHLVMVNGELAREVIAGAYRNVPAAVIA
jgi:hypothetical protein